MIRNNLCGYNNGEFLFWLIEILIDFVDVCDICNQSENTNPDENLNDVEISFNLVDEDAENKESKNNKAIKRSNSIPTANTRCLMCDECNDLLEQAFSCLFGYRKPRSARYLQNHASPKIAYNLENCINLYNYFKPAELPEYDSLSKFSISSEVIFNLN